MLYRIVNLLIRSLANSPTQSVNPVQGQPRLSSVQPEVRIQDYNLT